MWSTDGIPGMSGHAARHHGHRGRHNPYLDKLDMESERETNGQGAAPSSARALITHYGENSSSEDSDEEEQPKAGLATKKQRPERPPVMLEDANEFAERMGVSGLALLASTRKELVALVMIGLQAFGMQYSLLYHLWHSCQPRSEEEIEKEVPFLLLGVAIYLHFLSCFSEMPFGMSALFHMRDLGLTKNWCSVFVNTPFFITDALLTPLTTMVVGSFFLCSSKTVVDVLLNSCAAAFIKEIDNWILALNGKMKKLAGVVSDKDVHIPYNKALADSVEWVVIIFPVIPVIYTITVAHIGVNIMRL
eukprot:TRINITY_DN13622_c0_g1_i1.p1 TRINITY_DN13622_c0_g1~~TRINITY_DN13622_c0_g1_i1.p1  ORF type:complete len:327 (-),score=50.36 TRINITY_DN13622_c0_g1_i1:348-1262(-)